MADKRISQLVERTDIANNDVVPIVASGATTTNKATISSIQEFMQENLDLGVTSVGITLGTTGTDVNVTGSPITTSGNITINIPTASATNRGLLSASDWTSFNGKVPYTGATTSVDLGDNVLTAGGLNIDNLGANGGALNLRQATSFSLWSGAPYTSIYSTPGNRLIINFSNDNRRITLDGSIVSASSPRTFTFPDATGTLALTSDITNALTGYVTLGTPQTITGQKTFNSTIVGQNATLTSSGSGQTLLVTHSSGSGIALDISKGGNGEGIRVTKTSGTGNAVTISGGNLSAEAGQFSGDLQSATRVIAAASSQSIILTPNSGGTTNRVESVGTLPLALVSAAAITMAAGGTTPQITLATNGAVTLTGALNGTSASFTGNVTVGGSSENLFIANGNSFSGVRLSRGGVAKWAIFNNNAGTDFFDIYNYATSSSALTLASTGAATFSSSVTATNYLMNRGAGEWNIIPSSGANFLYFQERTGSNYIMTLDGASGSVGIGTTSPSAKLHLNGLSSEDYKILFSESDSNAVSLFYEGSAGSGTSNKFHIRRELSGQEANLVTVLLNGNVGIGTDSPAFPLTVFNSTNSNAVFQTSGTGTGLSNGFYVGHTANISYLWNYNEFPIAFGTNGTERMRITSDGYARLSASSGGIQFNGDTAAANALDDYEEGTWTPTVSAEIGSYTTITNARGRYTKVGRIVTLFYYFIVTTKGTGSGGAVVSNLPFSSLSSNGGDHYVGTGLNTSTAALHSVFLPQGSSSFTIYLNALDPITPTQGNSGSITYMT